MKTFACCFGTLAVCFVPYHSVSQTAGVAGLVRKVGTGQPVNSAVVSLKNLDSGGSTGGYTNESGRFSLTNVKPTREGSLQLCPGIVYIAMTVS